MSREIKFRSWVNDHWADWLPTSKSLGAYNAVIVDEDDYSTDSECCIEQYTGLKDKNGKEIYEGDLIKTKAGDILQVNSLTHSGWFVTGIKSHNEIQLWLLTIDDCIEVIGNTHENPELLEVRNEHK